MVQRNCLREEMVGHKNHWRDLPYAAKPTDMSTYVITRLCYARYMTDPPYRINELRGLPQGFTGGNASIITLRCWKKVTQTWSNEGSVSTYLKGKDLVLEAYDD